LSPINPRETAELLDALGGALTQINASQLASVEHPPCCGPCAGVSLVRSDDAIKDAAALMHEGHGGPLSIVCLAAAGDVRKGHKVKIRHERHGNGVRPVYYRDDGERIDPLAVYAGAPRSCGKQHSEDDEPGEVSPCRKRGGDDK
jgi:hypothetical protein